MQSKWSEIPYAQLFFIQWDKQYFLLTSKLTTLATLILKEKSLNFTSHLTSYCCPTTLQGTLITSIS